MILYKMINSLSKTDDSINNDKFIHWPSASPPPCPDQPSARPDNCGSVAMYGPVAKLEPTATLGQGAQGVHGAMCSLKVLWFFSQARVAV